MTCLITAKGREVLVTRDLSQALSEFDHALSRCWGFNPRIARTLTKAIHETSLGACGVWSYEDVVLEISE